MQKLYDALAGLLQRPLVAGLVGAVGGNLVFVAFHLAGSLAWIEQHQALAAWVQAVFSVVAIWAAFMVAERGAREARTKADEERQDRFDAIAGAAVHAAKVLSSAADRMTPTSFMGNPHELSRTSLASIQDAQRALAEIPIVTVPGGPNVIGDLMALRRQLAEAEPLLTSFARTSSDARHELWKLSERAGGRATKIAAAANQARSKG